MKHLGDVTKINGAEIEPVWCISFGSPCQDLSVAGKRAGLQGERSGLFTEATRIIKEMRSIVRTDVDIRLPRYALWENVPGALSSNKGDDFRVVLEELARIEDPEFTVPRCTKKWSKSGVIIGDTFSIAWRIHDAQFWGVPQRRKRISVLCDFDGHTAPDILFSEYYRETCEGDRHTPVLGSGDGYRSQIQLESEGCTRHLESCNEAWKGIARDPEESLGITHSCTLQVRGGCDGGGISFALLTDHDNRPTDMTNVIMQKTYRIGSYCSNAMMSNNPYSGIYEADTSCALDSSNCAYPGCNQGGIAVVQDEEKNMEEVIVRRLTPEECEALQGFPKGWTNIGEWVDSRGKKRKYADSPRYKCIGNSIALPFWYHLFLNMSRYLPEGATLGSLFAGMGGFDLTWESIHGPGTSRWSSEIEEFPIAVLKARFGDE